MKSFAPCGSPEHLLARRSFLGGLAAAGLSSIAGGLDALALPAAIKDLNRQQKRIIVFNLAGGLSQLESWDPKPHTATGGPFRAIATSVPGIHLSELLPLTARQMHHLTLVRSISTTEMDHLPASYAMVTGRRLVPDSNYPTIGAVATRALAPVDGSLPGHIMITPSRGRFGNDAAYLEPKCSSIIFSAGKPPQHLERPKGLTEEADTRRNELRRRADQHFLSRNRTAITDAYAYSFEQASQLMHHQDVFDVSKEPTKDADRYGKCEFGRHCLLARRLLEKGVTFVQVTHANFDSHSENFNFHLQKVSEFDLGFSQFVADIADRGMLDSTLIVVLSEFGRTPIINANSGRDHWARAWSIVMAGCRTPRGFVYGKTSADGSEVVDRQTGYGNLFHTYLQSVGIDSTALFNVQGREYPIADPHCHAIKELLT